MDIRKVRIPDTKISKADLLAYDKLTNKLGNELSKYLKQTKEKQIKKGKETRKKKKRKKVKRKK